MSPSIETKVSKDHGPLSYVIIAKNEWYAWFHEN